MPLFGTHVSVAGGLANAFAEFNEVGGEAFQIFTKNQRRWESPPITGQEAENFRRLWEANKRPPVAAHGSYLLNLASGDPEIARKTLKNLADELSRAEMLAIPCVVVHSGSHGGDGLAVGIERIAKSIAAAIEEAKSENATVLLENTSGAGNSVGAKLAHLRDIIASSPYPERLGVCLDTCHLFAAGYDLRGAENYSRVMEEVGGSVGFDRVRFFHVNDSKGALGSAKDRHEQIGEGELGLEGFKGLVTDPRWQNHPMIIETPPGPHNIFDKKNLKTLRDLASGS